MAAAWYEDGGFENWRRSLDLRWKDVTSEGVNDEMLK